MGAIQNGDTPPGNWVFVLRSLESLAAPTLADRRQGRGTRRVGCHLS